MSGYKRATVSINQDEYDRLREAEEKLRSVPQITPQVIQELSQQSQRAFQAGLQELHSRQASFETMVSSMDGSIRELEIKTNRAMVEFEADLVRKTQSYTGSLWNHFNQALAEHTARFEETIAVNHRIYQEELYQYARQVRRMEDDAQRKLDMAYMWLNAADSFCQFIKATYPYQEFAPGQVEWLERQLDQARQNLGVGLAEAVIVSAQQLYTAFSDLRIELERRLSEWQLLYQSARETVYLMLHQINESAVLPAVDLDGEDLPIEISVDYWTQGRLSALYQSLYAVCQELENQDTLPATEDLERYLGQVFPEYDQAFCDLVLEARIAALNSQLRINIADLVINALQEQGFRLDASDYESADMRQAFNAHLCNLEGNEVYVYVNPVGSEIGENELHVESLDRDERTEHELEQRWSEVDRSLEAYGLSVSGYERLDVSETHSNRKSRRRINERVPFRSMSRNGLPAGRAHGN